MRGQFSHKKSAPHICAVKLTKINMIFYGCCFDKTTLPSSGSYQTIVSPSTENDELPFPH